MSSTLEAGDCICISVVIDERGQASNGVAGRLLAWLTRSFRVTGGHHNRVDFCLLMFPNLLP